MADIQIISIRDLIPVSRVELAENLQVPTLRVTGEDFRYVAEVYVNDVLSPDVVVLNARVLLAQVPESVVSVGVRSVLVSSHYFTATTSASRMQFKLNARNMVDGIMLMAQRFFKILFTTPGSDVFHPTMGVGVHQLLGVDVNSEKALSGALAAKILQARDQLFQYQSTTEPLDRQLSEVRLLSVGVDAEQARVEARIRLENRANQVVLTNVGI